MTVDIAYLAFTLAALAVFWRCRPPLAALVVYLGGWWLLPVGHFPAGAADVEFPYWITGLAVPSDMLLTKAWVAPAAAALGVLAFDRPALRRLRPVWMDAPMLIWCLWPLLRSTWLLATQAFGAADPAPPGWTASLYLAGCWGLPWLLGRLYFATPEGALLLARGLGASVLAWLPFSVLEGGFGLQVYGLVYEPHPFRLDGVERYVGWRPLAFFEDGNQFGLWISLSALAALWVALSSPPGRARRWFQALAAVAVAMALATQSVGGILMLAIGAAFLGACRLLRPRGMIAVAVALLLAGGVVYLSGAVPIMKIGKETAVGQRIVGAFKAVGRGSFTWRISQDQKLLPEAMAHPVAGTARWDWWRDKGTRPWGLTLLVLGQFGGVGLAASLAALLAPAVRAAWAAPRASAWQPAGLPLLLAALVGLTVVDALMNSFVFFPALIAAGALAGAGATLAAPAPPRRARGEITRVPRRA